MTPPLFAVAKLETCEDDGLQETVARLNAIDVAFARDMVRQGAFPGTVEGWIRLFQFTKAEHPCDLLERVEGDDALALDLRIEAAYLGGLAVGLRLATLDGGAR